MFSISKLTEMINPLFLISMNLLCAQAPPNDPQFALRDLDPQVSLIHILRYLKLRQQVFKVKEERKFENKRSDNSLKTANFKILSYVSIPSVEP